MANSLSSINIKFNVDLAEFSSKLQNVSRQVKATSESMKSIGGNLSTYVTLPVLAAGGAAIKFASDYEESLNKVNVAFGDSSGYVENWAKSSLESFGIAEGSALDMASLFGDMATSMGLPQKEASKMSTSLTGLAGDLASFKNIGISEATTALNGIFTGETESLKRLGVVMTEANLKTFALTQGINKQVKDMTEAEKVNLRYAYVLAKTKNAQGDFERTGGGAANQMRVFQESLKQVGQQLGAVILPLFTKVITFVNEKIKAFSSLSETSKVLIVSIAGIAAAIGPLLSGLGSVLGFLPNLISSLKNVGSAWTTLSTLLAANPYTAIAAAIALVAGGLLLWYSNQKQVVSSQEALNSAVAEGNKQAQNEIGTLDTLYKTATNVKTSTNERKKAVDELQTIYPAYFKNIKDEAILNGQASASYKQLREDIFNKARAMAVEGEINRRAADRVGEETKLREQILSTEREIQRIRKGSDVVILQEANAIEKTARVTISKTDLINAQYKLLSKQRGDLAKFNADSLKEDEALLRAKQDFNSQSSKLTENELLRLAAVKDGTAAISKENEKLIKVGTIEFFEKQIDGLQKLQKEQATTNAEWLSYQNNIDGIQKKIDALSNTEVKLPTIPDVKVKQSTFIPEVDEPKTLEALNIQKTYYEGLRNQFSETSEQYKAFSETINGIQLKINAIEGVEEVQTSLTDIQKWEAEYITSAQEFNEGISSIMQNVGESFATGFGEMLAQSLAGGISIQSVWSLMMTALADMAINVGKLAIGIGVSVGGIKKALSSLNPAVAIAAGIALVALGTIAKSALSNIASGTPAFANGGIVGGSSFYGDKIMARVNSGELIMNTKQQRNLYGMLQPVSNNENNVVLNGGFKISGSDIELVVERALAKKSRTR